MGGGTFNPDSYRAYADTTVGKTPDKIFTKSSLADALNPLNVKMRESRDSADSPTSVPVAVFLDVTGSMGMTAQAIAQKGLGVLFQAILDKKPIPNPHIMFGGIGDAHCDQAPLQVSQFEADNRIVDQLKDLWLEGRGGGNDSESYHLPWYFAAHHIVHDSMEKRGKRGYLFTSGDEMPPPDLTIDQIKRVFGDGAQVDMTTKGLLQAAQRTFDCYHIIVMEGSHCRSNSKAVIAAWKELMGQHVIVLDDHTKLAEVVVAAIEIAEGSSHADVVKGWGGDKSIAAATATLPKARTPKLIAA